jgi:hypothetical protein
MNKVAFIVGNGISRQEIDLHTLIDKAPIYGCNALYRDFYFWNYLVAIDDGMIAELRKHYMNHGVLIIPPEEMRYEEAEYSPARRRANAGMVAMREAVNRHYDILYCLGFDFILKGEISTDNVYKGSDNYGPETHANQGDNYYRIKYLEWFARKNDHVKFVFVVPDKTPMNVIDAPNIVAMKINTFKEKIEGMT